ncbi:metallophosphoesterase [Campylobacter rectus]|uniref:metallophosphoesterase n=1 Tax=Campylobacter rectus TaxID=203 RepID=UPI0028F087DA|nr:metallophosphoesterase [Campylobacter rectus]
MSVYFTSDLHFGHELMLKKYPNFRKGSNAAEMDENLIAVWNALITPEDVVYDLGDVSFHKDFARTYEILRRLNGRHFLVLGNHDEQIVARKNELLSRRKADGNFMFEQIADYAFVRLSLAGAALSHYPMSEWGGCHKGSLMLYGHLHANIAQIAGRALNVGFDLHGKILSEDEVWSYLKDIPPKAHHASELEGISESDGVEQRRVLIENFLREINRTEK